MTENPAPGTGRGGFLASYAGRMFAVLTAGLTVVRVGRRVIPPLLPAIVEDLSITSVEAGVALSIMSATFALAQFPGGRAADETSRKTVLLVGIAVLTVGALLVFATPTFALFLVGTALIGAGEGLYGPADIALMSDLFLDNRGRAFGFHRAASDLAGILAAGLAVVFLALGAWRLSFVPIVVGLVVIFGVFVRTGSEPIRFAGFSLNVRGMAGRLLGNWQFRLMLATYTLFAFTTAGAMGFLPTLLALEKGFSEIGATVVFSTLFIVGMIAKPSVGNLSDRLPRAYVCTGALAVGSVGLALLVVSTSQAMAVVGVIVFAAGQRGFPPVMQALLMDTFPDDSMGGDLGATRTAYVGIGSLGPVYVGVVAGEASYTTAFARFVACFLAAAALTLSLSLRQ